MFAQCEYLKFLSGLDVGFYKDGKSKVNVFTFSIDGRVVKSVFSYRKARVFAEGVKIGRQLELVR